MVDFAATLCMLLNTKHKGWGFIVSKQITEDQLQYQWSGAKFKSLIIEKYKTVRNFATIHKLNYRTLIAYINKKSFPSLTMYFKFCKILKADPRELCENEKELTKV